MKILFESECPNCGRRRKVINPAMQGKVVTCLACETRYRAIPLPNTDPTIPETSSEVSPVTSDSPNSVSNLTRIDTNSFTKKNINEKKPHGSKTPPKENKKAKQTKAKAVLCGICGKPKEDKDAIACSDCMSDSINAFHPNHLKAWALGMVGGYGAYKGAMSHKQRNLAPVPPKTQVKAKTEDRELIIRLVWAGVVLLIVFSQLVLQSFGIINTQEWPTAEEWPILLGIIGALVALGYVTTYLLRRWWDRKPSVQGVHYQRKKPKPKLHVLILLLLLPVVIYAYRPGSYHQMAHQRMREEADMREAAQVAAAQAAARLRDEQAILARDWLPYARWSTSSNAPQNLATPFFTVEVQSSNSREMESLIVPEISHPAIVNRIEHARTLIFFKQEIHSQREWPDVTFTLCALDLSDPERRRVLTVHYVAPSSMTVNTRRKVLGSTGGAILIDGIAQPDYQVLRSEEDYQSLLIRGLNVIAR